MIRRGGQLRRRAVDPSAISPTSPNQENNLSDKLIETINNLTSNRELMNTRISVLNGEGLKTASILEIGGMYRSLVTQVAVLYETDEFETRVAPHIQSRFEELGRPSLIPGTIGSYIFGCYLSDYGVESLNKFCTPICAASIRIPNKANVNMRCTEKVIWTDGGDTPVFILVEDDPSNSRNGKVFIPWVGDNTGFRGLTQGAVDEIRSLGVDNVEIFGQLFNNHYLTLLSFTPITEVVIVDRIRIRTADYVSSKNGGVTTDKIHKVTMKKGPNKNDDIKVESSSSEDEKMERKTAITGFSFGVIIAVLIAIVVAVFLIVRRR